MSLIYDDIYGYDTPNITEVGVAEVALGPGHTGFAPEKTADQALLYSDLKTVSQVSL